MDGAAKFCKSCGAEANVPISMGYAAVEKNNNKKEDSQTAPAVSAYPPHTDGERHQKDGSEEPPIPPFPLQGRRNSKKKNNRGKIIVGIIGLLFIFALILIWAKTCKKQDPSPSTETTPTLSTDPSPSLPENAQLSAGAGKEDIGNIMNNQFYFATDKRMYYPGFDSDEKTHIYSADLDGSDRRIIFDGFGWSLVVKDDWLYFSGNPGDDIDNSYCIYRVKTDGSYYEKLNDTFSQNFFIYGEHLYFLKRSGEYIVNYTLCRMQLDGKGEESFPHDAKQAVAYKDKLYYNSGSGNLYRIDPNKENIEVIFSNAVDRFIISGDNIVYVDVWGALNICSLDGENITKIREKGTFPIYSLNTYNNRIYFSECDPNSFDYNKYGYYFTIKSVDFKGNGEKEHLTFYSSGIYMNLVDNRLMVFEYLRKGEKMSGQIKTLPVTGGEWSILGSEID